MSGSEDDPMLQAAEYALGSLDEADRRDAEAMAVRDPAFAAEIRFWQDRLAPLSTLIAPVQPPQALWARLALATGIGTPGVSRGNAVWKGATAVSLALAASMALFAFLPRPPAPAPEAARFAAAIGPLNDPAHFLAEALPDGTIMITRLDTTAAPAGHDFQLWALPPGAARPVSLGVLPPGSKIVRPPDRATADEQLLVSDEPAGGSTTGAPTGPVVFGGKLVPTSSASARGP